VAIINFSDIYQQKNTHMSVGNGRFAKKVHVQVVHSAPDGTPGGQARLFAPIHPVGQGQNCEVFAHNHGEHVGNWVSWDSLFSRQEQFLAFYLNMPYQRGLWWTDSVRTTTQTCRKLDRSWSTSRWGPGWGKWDMLNAEEKLCIIWGAFEKLKCADHG